MSFCQCGEEMEELSRDEKRASMKCLSCGKQERVFIKKNDSKINVPMWQSICVSCKKMVVGNKKYCSVKCFYKENRASDNTLKKNGFFRSGNGEIKSMRRDKWSED